MTLKKGSSEYSLTLKVCLKFKTAKSQFDLDFDLEPYPATYTSGTLHFGAVDRIVFVWVEDLKIRRFEDLKI